MADANYKIKDNPAYETEIRALKDSDRAQASTVFNPLLETMINNTHAVKKAVEAVDGKVKWTQYTDLSQLGLTDTDVAQSGTLATIINKLPARGHLLCNISNNTAMADLLPEGLTTNITAGLLDITNHGANRCTLTYTNLASGTRDSSNTFYRCFYRSGDANPTVTPWIKDVDQRDLTTLEDTLESSLKKVTWTQYISLAGLGLTDEDVAEAGTLALICDKMTARSEITISIIQNLPWLDLVPESTGLLMIKKYNTGRVYLDFWRVASTGVAQSRYYAVRRVTSEMDFISPWEKIAASDDIPDIKWTQYTSLADLGLSDEDVVKAGTLAVIVEAMPNWGILSLRVSGSSGTATWSNLLPNSVVLYGFLEIKKLANDGAYLIYRNDQYNGADIKVWYANYRTSAGQTGYINKISPWQQVSRQSDLNELAEAVEEAKKSVADGKTKVAKAISDKGQATAADATFDKMSENIGKIETGVKTDDATAIVGELLNGRTAYVKGVKITGTMKDNGAVSITLP